MWLQQDGARAHFGGTASLSRQFPDRSIGKGGSPAWPPRSPDLTPMDHFLWGHMNFIIYAKTSKVKAELINRIIDAAYQMRKNQETVMRGRYVECGKVSVVCR
jgi:hypothetical protein